VKRFDLAVVVALSGLLSGAGAVACGPGPTAETKAPAAAAKKGAPDCPVRPPTADATPGKFESVAGKRIAKLCLFGLDGDVRTQAQKALRSHEADPLDAERVREDIGNLLKTGVVEDVAISAMPVENEVVLVYVLRERPRISEVAFDGAHVFEKEGLTGKIAMEKLRPLVMAEVHDLIAAMKEEYGRRGYRSTKIDAKVEPSGAGLVKLKFVVVEGPQWKIGKVTFKGGKAVTEKDLKKAAALEEGTPFDEEKIERATMTVNAAYFDRGMINARIDRQVGEPDKDGNTPLTFVVDEGEVFRIGAIKLAKLAAADEKALLAKLKSKPKAVFSRTTLVDDVKTLTDTFAARGQKVDVIPRTDVDAKKKTLDVTLDVEAAAQ
jgi:outer membrane protein insertion porin family